MTTIYAGFGPTREATAWWALPLHTWECGAPRREQSTPVKTSYQGDETRLLGRPEFGLHPLEDACRAIERQAAAIQQRRAKQRQDAERQALATADLFRRLEAQFGLYAIDMTADLQGIGRDEVTLRLEAAGAMMEAV